MNMSYGCLLYTSSRLQQQLIDSIKAGSEPLDDELFLAIFEVEDLVERQRFIEAARNKCREEKKLTEFNGMLRACCLLYTSRCV